MKAGLDAFAHSVRDRDIDAAGFALFKEHSNIVVNRNLPDRGVATDMSWLSESVPAGEVQKLQAAATDRPEAQKAYGYPGPQPGQAPRGWNQDHSSEPMAAFREATTSRRPTWSRQG